MVWKATVYGRRNGGSAIGCLACRDGDGLDALSQQHRWHVFDIAEKLLKPALQVHAVVEQQVGVLGFDQVAGGGFVAVNFRPNTGNGLDLELVACDVLRHVSQHRKGGQHFPLTLGLRL